MTQWRSAKARCVLGALLRIGWSIKRQSGSHGRHIRNLTSLGVRELDDQEEIGPRMLARIAKRTGLRPDDV